MIESLDYTTENGTKIEKDITVFALSTCGFCRRALNFLRDNSIKFKYIYVDKMDFAQKQDLKKELGDKYNKRVVFPFCVIDDSDVIVGFTQSEWEKKFLNDKI